MESLQGHVALVTGASQGIGRACAVTLAKAGATVALAARNEEKLKEAVAQIEAEGGKAAAFPSGRSLRGSHQVHGQSRSPPSSEKSTFWSTTPGLPATACCCE